MNSKIVSLNVCGLRDLSKRRQLYRVVKEKGAVIVFLQETHCTPEVDKLWEMEWAGVMLNACGESNDRGVSILFKKGFKYQVVNSTFDPEGRFLITKIVNESGEEIVVANIYAPNNDNPTFFFQMIQDYDCEIKIKCVQSRSG